MSEGPPPEIIHRPIARASSPSRAKSPVSSQSLRADAVPSAQPTTSRIQQATALDTSTVSSFSSVSPSPSPTLTNWKFGSNPSLHSFPVPSLSSMSTGSSTAATSATSTPRTPLYSDFPPHVSSRSQSHSSIPNASIGATPTIPSPVRPASPSYISSPSVLSDDPVRRASLHFTKRHFFSKRKARDTNSLHASLPVIIFLFSFLFVAFCSFCFMHTTTATDGIDCRMPYMTPTYQDIQGFNGSFTRFGSKYKMQLYREGGVDDKKLDPLNGVPVIFIPGNAGSFRQVRSLAAECSHQYHSMLLTKTHGNSRLGHLDFFTADFSEDLTAFSGQTMKDQADYLNEAISYILGLYQEAANEKNIPFAATPKSVILIGHSMGGMVARTMVMRPRYVPGSVTTILTLAAPHSLPPLTFDWELVRLYEDVNKYWSESFSQELTGRNPLAHISLISLAGGKLDQMIPPEHTSLNSMVPDTNGFTVFTSTIPNVWAGVDHQAIVWCDQVRRVLASTLLKITDTDGPTRTKSLLERMSIFRKMLLTGLEAPPRHQQQRQQKALVASPSRADKIQAVDTVLYSGGSHSTLVENGKSLRLAGTQTTFTSSYMFPINSENLNTSQFSLMTDRTIIPLPKKLSDETDKVDNDTEGGLSILACKYPVSLKSDSLLSQLGNLVSMDINMPDDTWNDMMLCHNLEEHVVVLPRSRDYWYNTNWPEYNHGRTNLSYLNFKLEDLSFYDHIIMVDDAATSDSGSVIASIEETSRINIVVRQGLWRLLLGRPLVAKLPKNMPFMVDVSFENVWSSLLAFTAQFGKKEDNAILDQSMQIFTPVIRQYVEELHESKYYVNVRAGTVVNVSVHGIAPYSPFTMAGEKYNNLHFQIWSDSINQDMVIKLRVDFVGTISRIALHYRSLLAIFPILVVFLNIKIQFDIHSSSGQFISFGDSMIIYFSEYLGPLLVFVSWLPWFLQLAFVRRVLYLIEPSLNLATGEGFTNAFAATKKNDFFLGLERTHFWILGPIFVAVASGICYASYLLFAFSISKISWIVLKFRSFSSNASQKQSRVHITNLGAVSSNVRSTRLTMSVLFSLGLLALFIPYQFAVVAICILLFYNTVKVQYQKDLLDAGLSFGNMHYFKSEEKREFLKYEAAFTDLKLASGDTFQENDRVQLDNLHYNTSNFLNYSMSILMLILWIIPTNLPVMIVWFHNVSVRWATIYHSYHNLLAFIPIFLLTERILAGEMIPQQRWFSQRLFTKLMLIYSCAYCLIFGPQRSYWLHHLVNFFAFWLLITYLEKHFSHTGR